MHRFYLVRLVLVRRYMYVSFGVTDPEVALNVSWTPTSQLESYIRISDKYAYPRRKTQ